VANVKFHTLHEIPVSFPWIGEIGKVEIFEKLHTTHTDTYMNDSQCISLTKNAQAQVVYEKFQTLPKISMSFPWIGKNLALRNFFNMELCSATPTNMHMNHPNPRHLKEDDTSSLLEAKIHVLCGNSMENSRIGENFQLGNFLQVDSGCTGPTYDPSNQSFWNVVFRYNILHSLIMKIPPLCIKLTIILRIIKILQTKKSDQRLISDAEIT
jgi:hypothetical protein